MIDERVWNLFLEYYRKLAGTFGPGYENLAGTLAAAQWISQNLQGQAVQHPAPPFSEKA